METTTSVLLGNVLTVERTDNVTRHTSTRADRMEGGYVALTVSRHTEYSDGATDFSNEFGVVFVSSEHARRFALEVLKTCSEQDGITDLDIL